MKSRIHKPKYPTGVVTTNAQMNTLALRKHDFHGEWNDELRPRPT